jgi:hypothetical protein
MLSKPYPLHLLLRTVLLSPIVKLSCPRTLVSCHFLRMFERTVVGKIGGDPGCPKAVFANGCMNARCNGAPADHAPGIGLRHGLFEQHGRVVPRGCTER